MAKYVVALDQGTTSTRCMIFDHGGAPVASHQLEHAQIYPQPGWVEHDAVEIWATHRGGDPRRHGKAGLSAADIAAVGITNQRETTVVWDRNTGRPYGNAIVWQDTRTDQICSRLAEDGGQDRFRASTGLPLATYFSGPKIKWLLDNVPGLREAAERGDALFGNMDTWLIWNLTGGPGAGAAHVTDVTNASRTLLMNLETLDWDEEILESSAFPAPCCRRSAPPATRSSTAPPVRTAPSAARSPSAATSATSRRPLSARPASRSARRKTPTAPAVFCCSTPATKIVQSQHGLMTTVGYQFGRAATGLRPGRLHRHYRRPRPVAARQPGPDRLRRRSGESGRDGGGQRRHLLRPGVLRPVRPLLAQRSPRTDHRHDPFHHPGPLSPGPPWRPPPTRPGKWSTPWPRTRG